MTLLIDIAAPRASDFSTDTPASELSLLTGCARAPGPRPRWTRSSATGDEIERRHRKIVNQHLAGKTWMLGDAYRVLDMARRAMFEHLVADAA